MKHEDVISKMTLEEKAALLGGKGEWDSWDLPRIGLPSMIMSDGPHGIRRQAGAGDHLGLNESLPATCFPTAATMANSWDPALGEEVGRALGEEAKTQGVNILLGPGMNIKRSPLCGRNFEYFSEDPYLSGKMAASYVRGIHSQEVWSCIKHFAVNSQEERRMAMNAVLDERTLREIYLTGFEIAVKEAGARAVMTSYNMVNGTYANESKHLLTEILREDWGFDGVVITDWGGSNDHVDGVKAGSNLEMPAPGLGSARELLAAVKSGRLSEEEIDARVDELLDAILTTTEAAKGHAEEFDIEAHDALARKAAANCAVLLKNEESILPLAEGTKVAVIGDFAFDPRFQGAGSSVVNNTKLSKFSEICEEGGKLTMTGAARGYKRNGEADEAMAEEAAALAKEADVVLYFFGLNEISESEGLDRTHLRIPENQISLLAKLREANANVIGVLAGGSPIEMPWEDQCKAILHGYLTGQAGAGAILDILTGAVNPSGKLAETYPMTLEEVSSNNYYPAKERNADYREGLYVGYRFFDKIGRKVRYPFGYGLSYTTFAYSDLEVSDTGVTFTVENTGDRAGAEIAQMYVGLPDAKVFRADRELKGFAKVYLEPGEKKTVTIPFDDYTFRYWNVKTNGWAEEGGEYTVHVGGCSQDLPLCGTVTRAGDGAEAPYDKAQLPDYYTGQIEAVGDEEFAELLGYPVPDGSWTKEITENDAICQLSYAKSGLARFVYKQLESRRLKAEAAGKPDLNILFIYNMPFRAIAKMTGGMVDMNMVGGVVKAVNGHFFGGVGQALSGFFKNKSANKKYEKLLKGE